MKVKSESEVSQSCPTLCNPMDCSPPGSSAMGFSRQEYWSGVPLPSPKVSLWMHIRGNQGNRKTNSISSLSTFSAGCLSLVKHSWKMESRGAHLMYSKDISLLVNDLLGLVRQIQGMTEAGFRSWGWSLANSQQEAEDLCPTVYEKLNSANKHKSRYL